MGQYQNAVDTFFHDRSYYWRDVYQKDTLSAFIYRERRSAVLAILDNLRLPKNSRILEVGCGAGSTTVAMLKMGYRVSAVDKVADMLELTSQAAEEAGLSADLQTSSDDICQLSSPAGHFDLVLAVGVLPWLECPVMALLELERVTKSGGYIILTAANKWCLNQALDPLCFPGMRPVRWHIAEVLENFKIWNRSRPRLHRYSVRQIDNLLSHVKLQKIAGKTVGFGPFTIFKQKLLPDSIGVKVHQVLQALADRHIPGIRSLGVGYIVLAQKR